MEKNTLDYTMDVLKEILAVDSPGGFTAAAADYVCDRLTEMGYAPARTNKGGVVCCLGGADASDGLLLSAHIDTLGAMVSAVKGNGRLKMVPIGGVDANNIECECVRIYGRDGRVITGTVQLINPSVHVNADHAKTGRTFDTVECVPDEDVHTAEEMHALGIDTGSFVCFDTRFTVTPSGYIKSRFLDDKLSVAILLGYAKYLKENGITSRRQIWLHFTVYEEVGHGGGATMPDGITEMLAVDMGCVGDGIACTEKQVSICCKDASGPYNYEMTTRLMSLAKEKSIGHAVDVYPHYGSDCSAAQRTFDVRCAVIGPGVFASHGYERSHIDAVKNTFDLICAYTDV